MRRTKIVATLGPATSSAERINQIVAAGVDVARLNFSHGAYEAHARNITLLREAARQQGRPLAIMQDLQGPKIRTGLLANGGPVQLIEGQEFKITTVPVVGSAQIVSTTYTALPHDVRPGDRVLVSDGMIELRVNTVQGDTVSMMVVKGGSLRQNQGINLPGVNVSSPALTPKDIEDLRFGLSQGVDFVALSFVRRAADVQHINDLIAQAGHSTPVIAKIEKPEALNDLDGILQLVGGVMVARGDLGVEMPLEQLPAVQKRIINAANAMGVPVITATEMLQSMISNPRPTRAEASDVANAIFDGTDAVMLSGETAMGEYPVESVQTMARIAVEAEGSGLYYDAAMRPHPQMHAISPLAHAIGEAAAAVVHSLPIRAIVALTQSGGTARLMAHLRPRVPIIGITPDERIYRQLCLVWGVTPVMGDQYDTIQEFEQQTKRIVRERDLYASGEYVVITGGLPLNEHGPTNFLKLLELA
jgi:pyruvate kinase